MATSSRLRLREIRAAFQILGEVRDLGGDPHVWRSHLVESTRALIGASASWTMEMHDFLPGVPLRWIEPVDLGWDSDMERRLFLGYLSSGLPLVDPSVVAWQERLKRRRFATATRREMVPDASWYASAIVSVGRRSSRIDDCINSLATMGRPGRVHGFQFYRPWGARPFDTRDRKVVRLIHLELLRLIDNSRLDQPAGLPPRLHRVFACLLRGSTSKQIARDLGLSLHTVDGYIKELYRHCGVGSRAQLLTKYLPGQKPGSILLPSEF